MSNKKTILQICPRLNSGGIERGTVDVAIALKQAGYQTIVASGGGRSVAELNAAGVTHIELPLYRKLPHAIAANGRRLRQLIHEHGVTLVHARSRAAVWSAYCALKGTAIPFVTSCHSPHGAGFLNLKKLYNRPMTYGTRVIAISDFIADYLRRDYQLAEDKLRIIYRGIDVTEFDPARYTHQQLTALKTHYHIPHNKTIILLPGRITRWKGQDVMIEALALLNNPHLHVIMVGRVDSKDFFNELQARIDSLQLKTQVQFIDECFDIAPLYAVADITLSTSRKPEAFGRVAVEAQAMQSTVIATHLGAARETVIPDETGFLVTPDNPQQLSAAIQHALSLSQDELNALHQRARERVITTFNKQHMLQQTLAVYEECLADSSLMNAHEIMT